MVLYYMFSAVPLVKQKNRYSKERSRSFQKWICSVFWWNQGSNGLGPEEAKDLL